MEHITYTSYYDTQISYNHKCMKEITLKQTNTQVHNTVEFIYLKKGNVTYSVDEKAYNVENDFLIITLPRKTHNIAFIDLDIYDRYDVLFDEGMVYPEIYEQLQKAPHVINCKNLPQFIELFKRIDFYCNYFSGEKLKNLLSHIVDEICYNVAIAIRLSPDEQCAEVNPMFAKILEYIEKNISSNLTLDEISSELYVSTSYLHSAFRQFLNITPKKYVSLKRLTLAQNYLRQGEIATDIYEKCGYSDYSAFYRAYTKHFGYPPSEEKNKSLVEKIVY